MTAKKIVIGTVSAAALAATGVLLTAFMGRAEKYSTERVKRNYISEKVEATGEVHGERSKTFYSAITAPVSFYELMVGDEVENGEKVLDYDPEDLIKALDQAQLSAKSAENTMNGQVQASNSNQAKFNKAASDIEIYRNTYALFRQANDYLNQGQYQENWDVNCIAQGINKSIAETTAEINNKTLELELAGAEPVPDLKKIESLSDEIEELNNSLGDLNRDLAGLPPATLSPEEYAKTVLNGNWMSDIMRNWTEASTLKNTYENQILNSYQKEQLRNTYDLSELGVMTAEDDLNKAYSGVTVDFDGIVTESFIKAGTVAAKGTPLFTVEDSKNIKVDVGISKYDIGKIEVGQRAEIGIADSVYTGTVSEIKRLAKSDNSDKAKVIVYVRFDEPDERVYLGLEADVTIYTNEKEETLSIPSEAYYSDDYGDYCYEIEDGVIKKVYITVGLINDDAVEVKAGLKEGDTVITDAVTDDKIGTGAESVQE